MSFKNDLGFTISWNFKTVSAFILLLALPNVLGMINISTPFGFKFHFFQIAIFLAAMIYGPMGGLSSGAVGSVYSAVLMQNPYLIIGNMILGFFAGLFMRYGINGIISVMLAFLVQLPWLYATDIYLIKMPFAVLISLITSLAISNILWAIGAYFLAKPIRASLK